MHEMRGTWGFGEKNGPLLVSELDPLCLTHEQRNAVKSDKKPLFDFRKK